jgi:thioredoxin-like negative regulator of GroEL
MAPIVHGVEARYGDRMNFVYLDIDDPATETFKKQLGYRYQPHFFLLDAQGNILKEWQGPVPETEIKAAMDAALIN